MKIRPKALAAIQLTLGLIGLVLAIADKVTALPLPPAWTKYWGVVLASALSLRPILILVADYVDDGLMNNSFALVTPSDKKAPEPQDPKL